MQPDYLIVTCDSGYIEFNVVLVVYEFKTSCLKKRSSRTDLKSLMML
jgi:hypothetical protein